MNKETNIRELLAHYMDGDCTQQEQKMLKEHFASTKDLPADLAPYAQMFAIMQMGQEALQEIFSNSNEEQQLNELFNMP